MFSCMSIGLSVRNFARKIYGCGGGLRSWSVFYFVMISFILAFCYHIIHISHGVSKEWRHYQYISMAWRKSNVESPVCCQWKYHSLAPSHRYIAPSLVCSMIWEDVYIRGISNILAGSLVYTLHKSPVMRSSGSFFDASLNTRFEQIIELTVIYDALTPMWRDSVGTYWGHDKLPICEPLRESWEEPYYWNSLVAPVYHAPCPYKSKEVNEDNNMIMTIGDAEKYNMIQHKMYNDN